MADTGNVRIQVEEPCRRRLKHRRIVVTARVLGQHACIDIGLRHCSPAPMWYGGMRGTLPASSPSFART